MKVIKTAQLIYTYNSNMIYELHKALIADPRTIAHVIIYPCLIEVNPS